MRTEKMAVVLAIVVGFGLMVMTNKPVSRYNSAALVATPRFAVQFTTDPNGDYKMYPYYNQSWLSGFLGSLFGSWAGVFVAQNSH